MWSSVAGGRAAAGSSVTAVPLAGGGFTLFTVDPTGRVSTTTGSAQSGWGNWTSVADGKAALGSSVRAVPVPGGKFAVFATDPAGEVFTALGNATQGWGSWTSVSDGRAATGSSVAAVPTGGEGCRLFAVDPGGGVFTTAGDSSSAIKHVFVLVMENRSFDHMLGFSGIAGTDTQTGRQRKIDGLGGHEANSFKDADGVEHQHTVSMGAPDTMSIGPGHEFVDVLDQLCGSRDYKKGDPYPAITQNGFVASYASVVKNKIADLKAKASELPAPASTAMIQALNQMASHIDPGDVMKCFGPAQLPVLNALAQEYVVCDRWFSSMPGPTEPNRWFVHAASAGTFDESPSGPEIARAQGPDLGSVFHGFRFRHGTVFDLLKTAGVKYRIYAGDRFPVVGEIDEVGEQREFEDFANDLKGGASDVGYFHIEPSYGIVPFSGDADSQHPEYGGVAAGERFIKATYEAIRKSPLWENSLLIIIWDEHGGFYDHVPPPPAARTGETGRGHGFMFDHLGPRVPAVVISPLIPRNMIEHRVFDHTAIPATLSRVFRLPPLGNRDGINGGLDQLVGGSLRVDTPPTLPAAAAVTALASAPPVVKNAAHDPATLIAEDPRGNLTSVLHSAVVQHLGFAAAEQRAGILARVDGFKTHGEIFAYLKEVEQLVHGGPRKAKVALV
jgi:phospholipase C